MENYNNKNDTKVNIPPPIFIFKQQEEEEKKKF